MNDIYENFDPIPTDIFIQHKTAVAYTPLYHFHEGYEIFLFLDGNVNYYIEQNCYHLQRGNMLIIRPDEFHRAICLSTEVYERLVINIKTPYFNLLKSPIVNLQQCFHDHPKGCNNIALLHEHEIQDFMMLAHKLQSSYNASNVTQSFLAYSYLVELLSKTNCFYLGQSRQNPENLMPALVAETMRYIEDHLSEPISHTDIAENLFHNSTYINRKFKEATGLTIKQYIIHKRLSLAQQLLADSVSPQIVCQQSGFIDYSNFCRSFTRHFGCPPTKYKVLSDKTGVMETLQA